MSKKIHTEAVDHLFEAVLCLENKEDVIHSLKMCVRSTSCYHFLKDLKWHGCCARRKHIWRFPRRPEHPQQRSAV